MTAKTILAAAIITLAASSSYGWDSRVSRNGTYQEKDAYGRWTNSDNLYKDTDRDGVINKYDSNDRNPSVSTPSTSSYGRGYNSGSNNTGTKGNYSYGGTRSRY